MLSYGVTLDYDEPIDMRISKEEDGVYECNYIADKIPESDYDVKFYVLHFINEYINAMMTGKIDFYHFKEKDGSIVVNLEVVVDHLKDTGTEFG